MRIDHTAPGQMQIKTVCNRSGCRVAVEILSPHPLTGSYYVPYITSSAKPAIVGSASPQPSLSS